MGIDIWEVVDAAATKPYGFMRFEPGPGMGGHCLPVDPFYLTWRAREFQMSTEFIELAGKINQQMPYYCVERIELALNDVAKPIQGSKIAILGVAYKGGIGDIRESPGAADSQKGIVIGKGGEVLKAVDIAVRATLPEGAYLDLHVKVEKHWQDRDEMLNRLRRLTGFNGACEESIADSLRNSQGGELR